MHKRKLLGILKYGNRKYPKKKFQSGGTASSAGGYDWRDDPYEKHLAQEKLAKQRMEARKNNKKTPGALTKLPATSFTQLSGGLNGSLSSAQAIYSQAKDAYFDQIKSLGDQGIAWANSVDGRRAYQKVLDLGVTLQTRLKNEKAEYDKLVGDLEKTDRDTLAISENKAFVKELSKDDEGNLVGKFNVIDLDSYYEDPDKYRILTLNDFANWKANYDKSMDTNLMSEFLGKGAISQESLYDNYIKDSIGDIGLEFVKDNIVLTGANGNTTLEKDKVKQYIENIANGGSGFEDMPATYTEISSNKEKLNTLIDDIYRRVKDSVPQSSRLISSMQAAVLANRDVQEELKKKKTPEEKRQYIFSEIKLLLASRVLLNEKVKRKERKNSEVGGNNIKSDNDIINASGISYIVDGDNAKPYAWELPMKDGHKMIYEAQGISGGGGEAALIGVDQSMGIKDDPEKAKENLLGKNTILRKNLNMQDVYIGYGLDIVDAENSKGDSQGTNLLDNLLIQPGSAIDTVYLPTIDGKPAITLMVQMRKQKLAVREEFIKSYNKHNPDKKINIKADELFPGNKDEGKANAYKEYLRWLSYATQLDGLQKQATSKDSTELQKETALKSYKMGKEAAKVMLVQASAVKKLLRGNKVVVKPFAKISVITNGDSWKGWFAGDNIIDTIEKHVKSVLKLSGADAKNIDRVSEQFVKKTDTYKGYVENMKLDKFNIGFDDNYIFDVFIPHKNRGISATYNGQNAKEAKQQAEIEEAITRVMNTYSNIGDVRDIKSHALFFAR
jgi:hypothetical protein